MSSLLASCFLFFPLLLNPGSPFHHHLHLRSSQMIHNHSSDSHLMSHDIRPTLSNNGWTSNLQELVENNDLSSHTIGIKMDEEKKIVGIIRCLRVSPHREIRDWIEACFWNGAMVQRKWSRSSTHTWRLIKTTKH